jgi:arylsulfatase A-like enzyme
MTVRDELLAPWPRTESVVRQQLAEYYGMITQMDEQVGRILEALQDQGLTENTIVIFASDHGLAMGSHGLLGKQSLYEHSMRTPLVIAGPAVPVGETSHALVYLHDLFPTICGLADVAVPDEVEGISLQPVIDGSVSEIRSSLFTAYASFGRAVRDRQWKLIRWPQVNQTQLFDLQADPQEIHNLFGQPETIEQTTRLLMLLADWQKTVGDQQPLWIEGAQSKPVHLENFIRRPDPWQPQWIIDKYFDGPAGGNDVNDR